MRIKTNDIIFREDLYPRFEANQALIQKYAYSLEHLPPIKINQNNILIDGYHRWKAHQLEEQPEINVDVVETGSEKELKKLAYQLNSNHGLQLNPEEKKRYAQEMVSEMKVNELSVILSVGETTIKRWTETQRENLKQERDRKIVEMYLRAWNTQESIADILGVDVATVNRILQKDQMDDLQKDDLLLYNVWNTGKQDNATDSHFGSFPLIFMKNLLYYHTEPLDIVFDPFAGGGTTVDACKEMFRRYYCADRIVKPGREKDILEHDIKNGLPENLPKKPKLVFLDPPYWKQAEGKYSDSKDDLGNMTLDAFYDSMEKLFKELAARKTEKIAVVIQPTQYKNDFIFEDHIFKFHDMLKSRYNIEMRYILPYSTQQYNAQMVELAKEKRVCLGIHRDLVIWRLKDDETTL